MGRTGSPFEQKSPLLSDEDAVVGFKVTEYHPLCEAVGRSIECEELGAGDRRVGVRALRSDAGGDQTAAAQIEEVTAIDQDAYGQRYSLDFILIGLTGQAMVRSSWIIRDGEDFPRLTSCYVL